MTGRNTQIRKKLLQSKTIMSYMAFQTAITKLIEKVTKAKFNVADSFEELIKTKELFKKNGKQFQLHVDWPHQGVYKDLLVNARQIEGNDKVNREQILEFSCDDSQFLRISCRGDDEVIIEKNIPFKVRTLWSEIDIDELISNFNQVLRANQITYINKKPQNESVNVNKDEFAQLIHQYKDRNITYRIENVILKNAVKKANEFVFYINWVDSQDEHHLLKAIFSRSDLFYLPTNDYPGYSWVFTENALLTAFPEYRQYDINAGQFFYSLKIFELPSGQITNASQTEILNVWLTSDALFGELHHVGKGKNMSGNEVLNIYEYLDQLFRVKYTFICDASSLQTDDHSINIPLRLILALATGKTWYENKLSGVRLFECHEFQTVANGVVSQNIERRNLALRELQQLSLKSWYEMLNKNEQKQLYDLYLTYFDSNKPRRSLRLKNIQIASFDNSISIQDLTVKIYNASKIAKTITPDLISLVELLCGGNKLSEKLLIDKKAPDFWIKKRVNELLSGSTFWIKERKDEMTNPQNVKSLRKLML